MDFVSLVSLAKTAHGLLGQIVPSSHVTFFRNGQDMGTYECETSCELVRRGVFTASDEYLSGGMKVRESVAGFLERLRAEDDRSRAEGRPLVGDLKAHQQEHPGK